MPEVNVEAIQAGAIEAQLASRGAALVERLLPQSTCESLAAMFEESSDPIEVIKWKEIYETMEVVTDRCEDVANVIEGIILKMA